MLIFLAIFLLFSKSKYFPKDLEGTLIITCQHPVPTRIFSGFLLTIAAYIFILESGVIAGLVAWSIVIVVALGTSAIMVSFLNQMDKE